MASIAVAETPNLHIISTGPGSTFTGFEATGRYPTHYLKFFSKCVDSISQSARPAGVFGRVEFEIPYPPLMNPKPNLIIGVLFFAAATSQSYAAALLPIAASGWNQDIVIGSGEAFTGTTATMDANTVNTGNTWYGVGNNGAAPLTGLPVGPTVSVATPSDLTFDLQSFTANNAILTGSGFSNSGLLTLTTPTSLLRLALIGSRASGVGSTTITVNYATGAPDVFSGGAIDQDWSATTFADAAFKSQGRVNLPGGSYNQVNVANRMTLFQSVFTLTNTSNVVSVNIANSGGGNSAIMALSGEINPIPEPSVTALLGLAALGLFSRRRR